MEFPALHIWISRGKEASADDEFHVLSGVESLVEMGMNLCRTYLFNVPNNEIGSEKGLCLDSTPKWRNPSELFQQLGSWRTPVWFGWATAAWDHFLVFSPF